MTEDEKLKWQEFLEKLRRLLRGGKHTEAKDSVDTAIDTLRTIGTGNNGPMPNPHIPSNGGESEEGNDTIPKP